MQTQSVESTKNHQKRVRRVVFLVVMLSLAYAYVRYNIVRDVPFANFPLYIANKAIAMASAILIGISFLLGPLARFSRRFVNSLELRKGLGLWGFGMAAFHAVASLLLLSPAYYERIYGEAGKLTLQGESFLAFGILAFLVFSIVSFTSVPGVSSNLDPAKWKSIQRLGYLGYCFVLFHVAILGYGGWFKATSYTYGLASISLISVMFIVLVLLLRSLVAIFPKKKV